MFQSTRPRGARQEAWTEAARSFCFNPRAHAGRDPTGAIPSAVRVVFQSTRPRGARPKCRRVWSRARRVSIHAPTRGATRFPAFAAPVYRCFNPRAHAGRDPIPCLCCARISMFQSTRPRGARRRESGAIRDPNSFNPRAHAGRDAIMMQRLTTCVFQSTRPRGARHGSGSAGGPITLVSIHAPTRGATARR